MRGCHVKILAQGTWENDTLRRSGPLIPACLRSQLHAVEDPPHPFVSTSTQNCAMAGRPFQNIPTGKSQKRRIHEAEHQLSRSKMLLNVETARYPAPADQDVRTPWPLRPPSRGNARRVLGAINSDICQRPNRITRRHIAPMPDMKYAIRAVNQCRSRPFGSISPINTGIVML